MWLCSAYACAPLHFNGFWIVCMLKWVKHVLKHVVHLLYYSSNSFIYFLALFIFIFSEVANMCAYARACACVWHLVKSIFAVIGMNVSLYLSHRLERIHISYWRSIQSIDRIDRSIHSVESFRYNKCGLTCQRSYLRRFDSMVNLRTFVDLNKKHENPCSMYSMTGRERGALNNAQINSE